MRRVFDGRSRFYCHTRISSPMVLVVDGWFYRCILPVNEASSIEEFFKKSMKNKKFRVIIDFDFQSKKKFTYEFKFINISNPGYEINALNLVEYLKEVTLGLERRYSDSENSPIKESKLYH